MTGPIRSAALRTSVLRQRRKTLLRRLPALEEILRGSLIERYKACGRPGCKCARGPGHGPKYYLSVSRAGQRPEMDYVPGEHHEQVTRYLDNFRRLQRTLDEVCAINREILRRREPL